MHVVCDAIDMCDTVLLNEFPYVCKILPGQVEHLSNLCQPRSHAKQPSSAHATLIPITLMVFSAHRFLNCDR